MLPILQGEFPSDNSSPRIKIFQYCEIEVGSNIVGQRNTKQSCVEESDTENMASYSHFRMGHRLHVPWFCTE